MIKLPKINIFIAALSLFLCQNLVFAQGHLDPSVLSELLSANNQMPYVQDFDYSEKHASAVPLFSNINIENMRKLIKKYQTIVASGGWPTLPSTAGVLQIGSTGFNIRLLRQRLILSGDLSAQTDLGDYFGSYFKLAVQNFQQRCGLPVTGIVDELTRQTLNISAQTRLHQLQLNLQRLLQKKALIQAQPRYVCVNIPGLKIEAVENGKIIQYHKAVVGKLSRKTPILDSNIYQVILNPYWSIPSSIARRDLLPILKREPNYLTNNHIIVYDAKGQPLDNKLINWNIVDIGHLRFRQEPGQENAMSSTKINFYNNYDVYMHDTPEQAAFNSLIRFDSSGCVRVHNIRDLDVWLLKNTAGWPRARLEQVIASRKNYVVNLKDRVGVHFVYITAWAQDESTANFRNDVYGFDNLAVAN